MGDGIPPPSLDFADPTVTRPMPLHEPTPPSLEATPPPARARERGVSFSVVSFVLGVLVGSALTSCVAGLGMVAMALFAW